MMVHRALAARVADIVALTAIAAVGLWLFRSHLMGRVVFIGDSDRLNTFLNILTFQVEALRGRGLSAWDPLMFSRGTSRRSRPNITRPDCGRL
jgi:hypothetical protein